MRGEAAVGLDWEAETAKPSSAGHWDEDNRQQPVAAPEAEDVLQEEHRLEENGRPSSQLTRLSKRETRSVSLEVCVVMQNKSQHEITVAINHHRSAITLRDEIIAVVIVLSVLEKAKSKQKEVDFVTQETSC